MYEQSRALLNRHDLPHQEPGSINKLGSGQEKRYTLSKAGEAWQGKPLQRNKSSAN
jgi:hypothetical protein